MRSRIVIGLGLAAFLASCDSGSSSSTASNSGGTLQGAYKSTVAIKGEYQTFAFGSGSQFIYRVDQGNCLVELDTGTAQLQDMNGTQALQMTLTKGSGADWNYTGSGCAPVVPYTADQIAILGGPYPFHWVTQGTSFQIQFTPTQSLEFDKI